MEYKGPPIAHYFAWRVILNRVTTKENLRRKETTLQDTFCALCGLVEETIIHLFFTYNIANKVWNMDNRLAGISIRYHNQLYVHFQNFKIFACCILTTRGTIYGRDYKFLSYGTFGVIGVELFLDKEKLMQRKFLP